METLQQLVYKYIELDYKRLLRFIEIDVFKHSHSMYNVTPEDVLQSAVMKLIEYVTNNGPDLETFADKDGVEIESENLRGYIFNSLKNNASNFIYDMRREDIAAKEGMMNAGVMPESAGMYGRIAGVDSVEHRDVLDSISPSFVKMIKGSENNEPVLDIMRKTGIGSVRKFYEAKTHLEKELEFSGVDLNK